MTEYRTLERAATLILECLPGQVRDLAIELADLQYSCPRWHVVAGAVLRLSEEGRLADFSTEPHWSTDKGEPEPTKCKHCNETFMPKRLGQIYCSERCGQAAMFGEPHADRDNTESDSDAATAESPGDASDSDADLETSGIAKSIAEALAESAELQYKEITS